MADNRLSTFLPDDKAAFGVFPQMKPRRRLQDVQGSANVPLDVMRGRLAGLLGTPTDLANMLQSPMPTEMFGNTQYEPAQQLPYGSEYFFKNLPLAPTSRVGEVAGQAGAFVPLNPMPAARAAAAGVKALGPTAGRMAEGYLQRTGGILPLDVYHGSPYKFDAFDASKIGSGEGAQAYGHGLYFAESPEVAKNYTGAGGVSKASETMLRGRAEKVLKNPEAHAASDVEWAGKTLNQLNSRVGNQLYKVDLPDEQIAKMLDWDKPLSQQPNAVKALRSIADRVPGLSDALQPFELGSTTGRTVNDYISRALSPEDAARLLKDSGIPGIKYLDEGSRNLANTWIVRHPQGGENVFSSKASAEAYLKRNPEETLIEPKGTRNFVTFPGEEKSLTILERNGQPSQNSLNSFIQ